MLVLAVLSLLGKNLNIIPVSKKAVSNIDTTSYKSVFLLGIFSGAATSCCAPVLAGAVTLAALSGAFWKALIVTFAYVFGMTFPLFITAYFYDRFKIENSSLIKGKIFEIKLSGKTLFVHSTNLLAALVFFVMGGILLYLALSGNAFWAPSFQAEVGQMLNVWSQNIFNVLDNIPDIVWGLVIVAIFLILVYSARRSKKVNKNN
jgi:hypothetical protein